uniref:Ig-like domain-containing protein n=1 Tax=Erpetoichthys calabaricus TaxID=27687 RepID=A0A8C4SQ34_ERPCA
MLCVTLASIVVQPHQSLTAQVGGSVTLECFINPSHRYNFIWLKQEFGQSPRYIVSSFGFLDEVLFHNEFLGSSRHHIVKNNTTFNLIIADLELSDTGIYSCGVVKHGNVIFGNGTELPSYIHIIQRYNVYWFHHTLGGSYQGIINPKEKSLIKCDTSSQECIYSLQKLNYSSEDAGTYYCALVQCGEILLGNGTELTGNKTNIKYLKKHQILFLQIFSYFTHPPSLAFPYSYHSFTLIFIGFFHDMSIPLQPTFLLHSATHFPGLSLYEQLDSTPTHQ